MRSVLTVPSYENEPVLLTRLAEAHLRLRDRVGLFPIRPRGAALFVAESTDFGVPF